MYTTQLELFKNLDKDTLAAIKDRGVERIYGKDSIIFYEGVKADKFYILEEGSVRLSMGGDKEEICFLVDQKGEVFGWSALVDPHEYRARARCMTSVRLLEIQRETIESIIKNNPEKGVILFRNLSAIITERMCRMYQQRMADLHFEASCNR